MGPHGDIKERFSALSVILRGFDSRSLEEKKRGVLEALELTGAHMERGILSAASRNIKQVFSPLSEVRGVGPKLQEKFKKKGLNTVFDLLYYLPRRYEDRSRIQKIRDFSAGQTAQTIARVVASGEGGYGRRGRKIFEVVVDDGTALLHLKWFHYRPAYTRRFIQGQMLLVHGLVARSNYSRGFEIIHPDIEFIGDEDEAASSTEGIVAVYPEIEGVHQKTLRKIMLEVVTRYAVMAPGGVPPEVLAARGYKDLPTALREAHFPTSMPAGDKGSAYAPAALDLAFDELFLLETAMLIKRRAMKKKTGLRSYSGGQNSTGLEARLRGILPFSLTKAQERAIREIKVDMAGDSPMNRLLEGDVGSGKTIVCLIASLLAVDSGLQAAIMAPTSLLAEQHYKTISAYADKLDLRTTLLLGGMPVKERESRLREIKEGSANLVIGTHALIQKDVEFKALGLVIVDEQHRFGVLQRAELTRKGVFSTSTSSSSIQGGAGKDRASPDVLIMTATPIPRTLSMTVFANLEVSILDELPPGRRPVKTRLLGEKSRERVYEIIRREAAAGAQAYIVYPLVEESGELDLKDATKERDRLDKDVFPGLKVGLIHGRMSPGEKEEVMRGFKDGEIQILVATTVIEVGLDVSRATVMLIEHAERFGLAQLHQLRGRVGRGKRESYCLLMKNNYTGEDSYRRLKVLESSTDGFRIAEEDLKIRGPGDYLGERQSGLADFRFAWALMDYVLVKAARSDAESFLAESNGLGIGAGPLVAEALKARWSERLELAGIA